MALEGSLKDTAPKLSITFMAEDAAANERGVMTSGQKWRLLRRRALVLPLQMLLLFTGLVLAVSLCAVIVYGQSALTNVLIGPIGTEGIPLYL